MFRAASRGDGGCGGRGRISTTPTRVCMIARGSHSASCAQEGQVSVSAGGLAGASGEPPVWCDAACPSAAAAAGAGAPVGVEVLAVDWAGLRPAALPATMCMCMCMCKGMWVSGWGNASQPSPFPRKHSPAFVCLTSNAVHVSLTCLAQSAHHLKGLLKDLPAVHSC